MKTNKKSLVLGGKLKCPRCGFYINGSLSSVERHSKECKKPKKRK